MPADRLLAPDQVLRSSRAYCNIIGLPGYFAACRLNSAGLTPERNQRHRGGGAAGAAIMGDPPPIFDLASATRTWCAPRSLARPTAAPYSRAAIPLISMSASLRTSPLTTTPVAAGQGGPCNSSRRT